MILNKILEFLFILQETMTKKRNKENPGLLYPHSLSIWKSVALGWCCVWVFPHLDSTTALIAFVMQRDRASSGLLPGGPDSHGPPFSKHCRCSRSLLLWMHSSAFLMFLEQFQRPYTSAMRNLFHCLAILSVKYIFLITNLNLLWHNLRLFLFVLSLETWQKRLQSPFR